MCNARTLSACFLVWNCWAIRRILSQTFFVLHLKTSERRAKQTEFLGLEGTSRYTRGPVLIEHGVKVLGIALVEVGVKSETRIWHYMDVIPYTL